MTTAISDPSSVTNASADAPPPDRASPSPGRRALRRDRCGYVGIDIGSRYVKIAQVELVNAEWTLRAAETVDLGHDVWQVATGLPQGLGTLLRPAIAAARFRGRDAVCLLPDKLYQHDAFEFTKSRGRTPDELVADHLAQKQPGSTRDEMMSDFWTYPLEEAARERAEIVSMPSNVVRQLVEEIKSAGLEIHCLDSPATVAARAAGIADPRNPVRNVALIDWGDRVATFTFIVKGIPVFTRTLRNAGFRRLIDAAAARLNLGDSETETLLRRYGSADSNSPQPGSIIATELSANSSDVLHDLRDELRRTQTYLRRRFPQHPPDHLLLQGGGASQSILRDLARDEFGLEPRVWSVDGFTDGSETRISRPVFANAISLSAFAFAG